MLIQGDVFRPPRAGMFLPVCVGMGIQIGLTVFITLGILFSKKIFISSNLSDRYRLLFKSIYRNSLLLSKRYIILVSKIIVKQSLLTYLRTVLKFI